METIIAIIRICAENKATRSYIGIKLQLSHRPDNKHRPDNIQPQFNLLDGRVVGVLVVGVGWLL
jgi:hypothetical protein